MILTNNRCVSYLKALIALVIIILFRRDYRKKDNDGYER